ncbi:two-component system, OmpR family, sensor histidine kinase SenX3 [Jatrophihabitans endophyticus]|uniref:Sensor-like histidine kinase SenX3 n=1 Tax=Jatrophihabitans endophyticus TaxID=1206085 RepID=A0A1M5QVT3_9ACTN|nr:ATP-binding protein [Jatrophihabitans endophyticus]SHH18287.1 two-component system, OmpR family, sensor histidine kinase SenX3 [Jatrophihabitans endophyticus]
MAVLATIVALVALAVGVVLGLAVARGVPRSGDVTTPGDPASDDPASPPSVDPQLASLVVEALDHGVVVIDREERAVLVNPAARAMGILDVDTLAFPGLVAVARKSLETGEYDSASIDLPIGRLGREPIALSVTGVPLLPGPDERVAAVCLLLSDVSELRRLEAVRRDFVANVSHELKTPVGALTLLAEAIQDAADDPEAVHRFAGRIQHEGSRLARLVGELMELSRVQGADPMPGATVVGVETIVTEAIERTRLAAEQASITVTRACVGDVEVRGNKAQLATAVANLVDNAIAYSGSGTRVAVTARLSTDIDARPTVDISVTDQGIGIAEADRERIFERFYRVDPARSRATGGTGLGLAIVKNIVTNHLGTVSVWSADRSGSTFTIRLPRVHSDRPSSATSDTAGPTPPPSRGESNSGESAGVAALAAESGENRA